MISTTKNPALKQVWEHAGEFSTTQATYKGIALKCIYFIMLTLLSSLITFISAISLIQSGHYGLITVLLVVSLIATLICGFLAVLSPSTTKITGSIYALAQGFTMGFTALLCFTFNFGGEVFYALFATIITFAVMTLLYTSGTIRVTSRFKRFIFTALISVILINLITFIISLFSDAVAVLFYGSGTLSIGISVIMVALATFMLLIDFDRMTQIVNQGLDRKFEWLGAFGLLVTLIWLYMEFLKLFIKLSGRRR